MSTNTHIIESEMVDSFNQMLLSSDKQSINLAVEILDNRDKTNEESEIQYDRLMTMIINGNNLFPNGNNLFPSQNLYVIRIKGRLISVKNRSVFYTEGEAKKWLSYHLTSLIGVENKIPRWYNSSHPHYQTVTYDYLRAIRNIFESGIKLRNFLVKNNLVQFEKISA